MVRLGLSACSNSAAAVAARGREAIATYLPNCDPFPGSDDPKVTVAGVARAHLLPNNGTRFNPLLVASHSVRPLLPDCCEDQRPIVLKGLGHDWTHTMCSHKSDEISTHRCVPRTRGHRTADAQTYFRVRGEIEGM